MKKPIGTIPNPSAINLWSPSSYNLLSRCPLSLAYDHDEGARSKYRRSSTFTALGSIAHELTERVSRHDFDLVPLDELKIELGNAWDEKTAKEFDSLIEQWSPAVPPQPRDWPFYATVKAKTLTRLKNDVINYRERLENGAAANAALVEIEMKDNSLGLAGRADRIERHGEKVSIVDLKSGANVDGISDDNRRQLLLYAHLYRKVHGVTPESIVVMNSGGKRFEERIEPTAIDAVINTFKTTTTEFNTAVGAGKNLIELATPSEQSCRWCSYRVTCPRYWSAIEVDWNVNDLAGTIISKQGDVALTIEIFYPEHRRGEFCQVLTTTVVECVEGDFLTITDAFFEGDVLRCRWNSRFEVSQ